MAMISHLLLLLAVTCLKARAFRNVEIGSRHRALTSVEASVQAGDVVLVVGATSGIGQLVTQKLAAAGLSVRATSRSKVRGQELLSGNENVQVVELDLLQNDSLLLNAAMNNASAVVISVGTTAFPTIRWKGGNTPDAVDKEAVIRIAEAAAKVSSVKKVVIVTSVGVDRTKEMPFLVLNLFGVLDAKKAGEDAIKKKSSVDTGYNYVIVRPGRLVGGPFTNLDVAKLLQIDGGAENGVDVVVGDALLGDCKRDACAECIVQCLTNEAASNLEFSIVSTERIAWTPDQWTEAFQNMLGTVK